MLKKLIICALASALLAGVAIADKGAADELSFDHAVQTSPSPMGIIPAAILGVVEGLTEYLPVSSTGHLIVAQRLMGIGANADEKTAADAYAICIQSGAILAVIGLYFRKVRAMALGLVGRDREGRRDLVNIVVAFLPAALVGLLFAEAIKSHLFGLWPIVAAWFAGGAAILIVGWSRRGHPPWTGKDIDSLTAGKALVIGLIQCLAMWPGVSRSLVTIVGGIIVGLSLPAAVVFSFLLGAVTLSASTAYDMLSHGQAMLAMYGPASLLTGFVVAWISAIAAVRWMLAFLNKHGFAPFGYYRVAIALVVTGLILGGVL
ncbi:MAG: undecaprenyl-diphosphate phosphatase [Verrucomicrobia bacterium]|nr:undecaprenyl-diphosphate phosphatase [Verrucomicrobiota bacterium]